MFSDRLLMIFVKNPELGKVKTRLAKTVGANEALRVYRELLLHTNDVSIKAEGDKAVFYSDYIDDDDMWSNFSYQKYLQEGMDLGSKLLRAFELSFEKDYRKVVVIGSDCPGLTTDILDRAFEILDYQDIVLGPATDGGYYLMGMSELHRELFENKHWSTENVMLDTLLDIQRKGLSYALLPTLSDVDFEEDLNHLTDRIGED